MNDSWRICVCAWHYCNWACSWCTFVSVSCCSIWRRHVKHVNETWLTHGWVMAHIWMSHGTQTNESWHAYEWVMAHAWVSRVTYMNKSWQRCEWVIAEVECVLHSCDTQQHVSVVAHKTHCNILQHTAAYCNILQHATINATFCTTQQDFVRIATHNTQ